MKKFFSSFYLIFMISSVFAHNLTPKVVAKIKDRAATANLDWIGTKINPEIIEDFRNEVDKAIKGSAGTLKYLAFYMPRGTFHNDILFNEEDYADPTPLIESIAVQAFVHALDSEDSYDPHYDEDISSPAESEEAAIQVLKECCRDFSKEIGLI